MFNFLVVDMQLLYLFCEFITRVCLKVLRLTKKSLSPTLFWKVKETLQMVCQFLDEYMEYHIYVGQTKNFSASPQTINHLLLLLLLL